MKSKGWIFRNSVASLSEEFFCFNKTAQQQIFWYHDINQIKLSHRKDQLKSKLLIVLSVLLFNLMYFWSPSNGKIEVIMSILASASFLIGYWNPFTEARIKITFKNQAASDFKVDKKNYKKYREIVSFVQKTVDQDEKRLSNQMVLHDWSLNAV